MAAKKWIYYIFKFTLINEILGFLYWALAIYGLFITAGCIETRMAMITILLVYIIAVATFYIFVVKRVKYFLKGDSN